MAIRGFQFSAIFLLLIGPSSPEKYDWRCTDELCQKVICPELAEECMNNSMAVLVPYMGPCNCCDHCFQFKAEGETCLKGPGDFDVPKFICEPGHTCNEAGKCQKMNGMDPHFFKNYICTNGDCRCASMSDDGRVTFIFGEFKEEDIKDEEVQCECSIVAYKAMTQTLRALPFDGIYQPSARCLGNGQFDPLQCVEDKCGCVEKDTGIPDENGFVFSVKFLERNHPKCFNSSRHTAGRYYTDCEKRRNYLMREMNEGVWNDVNIIHFQRVNCSPDGKDSDSTKIRLHPLPSTKS